MEEEELLNKALDFATNYESITEDERNIIIHAKSSLLTNKQEKWQTQGISLFDVTMGSFEMRKHVS